VYSNPNLIKFWPGSKQIRIGMNPNAGSESKSEQNSSEPQDSSRRKEFKIFLTKFLLWRIFFRRLRGNARERDPDLHVDGRLPQGDHRTGQGGQPWRQEVSYVIKYTLISLQ